MSSDATFRMTVEDVFSIHGRGTVVTGRIERGWLHVGDTVQLLRADAVMKNVDVTGIEMFQKTASEAKEGDNVGVLLAALNRDEVQRGDVLAGSDFVWEK